MGDSSYIFQDNETLYYVGNLLGMVFATFGIYQLYKRSKQRYIIDEKGKKGDRIYFVIAMLMLAVGTFYSVNRDFNKFKRIEKYNAETYGLTTERIITGKSSSAIKYKFMVNGKSYFGASDYIYGGETITGIIVPGGNYKVIYNKNDPNQSVMDFKVNK